MLCFAAAVCFFSFVVCGVSPKLQTLWVTTAMTTMNHQWLATSLIPEDTINQIMEENYVDDSQYNSEMQEIVSKDNPFYMYSVAVKTTEFIMPDLVNNHMIDSSNIEDSVEKYLLHKQYTEQEGYQCLENGIYLKEISGNTWKGYIMLIQDPTRIHLLDTEYQYQRGETVKDMLQKNSAIAGINGGGFCDTLSYNSKGETPAGLLIKNGQIIAPQSKTNATYNMIGFNSNGVLVLQHCTPQWAIEHDIQDAVSFSPFLIVNGEGTIKNGTGGWGIAPRTAIGQRATGEVLFLVIDGRQPTWSIGVDIKVVQDELLKEQCMNAALLDGGSSTVMIYNGYNPNEEYSFVNKPSLGRERWINNCWAVF